MNPYTSQIFALTINALFFGKIKLKIIGSSCEISFLKAFGTLSLVVGMAFSLERHYQVGGFLKVYQKGFYEAIVCRFFTNASLQRKFPCKVTGKLELKACTFECYRGGPESLFRIYLPKFY